MKQISPFYVGISVLFCRKCYTPACLDRDEITHRLNQLGRSLKDLADTSGFSAQESALDNKSGWKLMSVGSGAIKLSWNMSAQSLGLYLNPGALTKAIRTHAHTHTSAKKINTGGEKGGADDGVVSAVYFLPCVLL